MANNFSNDNVAALNTVPEPDAHGQAAMLLVESLLHGLIDRRVISVADAVEIVDVAVEVKRDIGEDLGDSPATLKRSVTMLQAISSTLKQDVPIATDHDR